MDILTCSKCRVNKPTSDFHKSSRTTRGFAYQCRKCSNAAGALLRQRPAYNSYDNAKKRCTVPSHDAYKWVGGRGITFDPVTFKTYETFWEAYGDLYEQALKEWPNDKLTIDRIDNDALEGYYPGNIRFVPQYINENNRSDNYNITYQGKTQSASMWAREFNLPVAVVLSRHKAGWSMQLIMHTPNDAKLTRAITNQIKTVRNEKSSGFGSNGWDSDE